MASRQGADLRRWIDKLKKCEYKVISTTGLKLATGMHEGTFYKFKKKGAFIEEPGIGKYLHFNVEKTITRLQEMLEMEPTKNTLPELKKTQTKSEIVESLVHRVHEISMDGKFIVPIKMSGITEMELFEAAKIRAKNAAMESYRDSMLESADEAKARDDQVLEIMLLRTYAMKKEELEKL